MAIENLQTTFEYGRNARKRGEPISDSKRFHPHVAEVFEKGWKFQDAVEKEVASLPKIIPKDLPSSQSIESKP